MNASSFLVAIFIILSTREARRVLSSNAAAKLTLATLSKEDGCDDLKKRLSCLSSRYRTFDGSCNNLCNITLGMTGRPLIRFPRLIKPTAYEGDNFAPREFSLAVVEKPGFPTIRTPLPNARKVSFTVFESGEGDLNNIPPEFTHLTMTWGQFVDHDVTLTELAELPEGVSCGTNTAPCPIPSGNQIDCFGINIHLPQFALEGLPTAQCIPLRRSARTLDGQQLNIITHFIDGSQVYGSDKKTADELRDRNANLGLLLVLPFIRTGSRAQPILPPQDEEAFCRSEDPETEPCLRGGDERVNENQALTAMHTIWVREHNRIALALHVLNPKWDDERLFQEARKIVIAEIQHITYNEWLEVLFSKELRINANVALEGNGTFFTGYNPHASPEMTNVFSTAALRMGHTLIRDTFQLDVRGLNNNQDPVIQVKDFFNPSPLFEKVEGFNPYGAIFNGLSRALGHAVDPIFTAAVRENLIIEGPGNGIIGDLVAINMQRGRDHGIPGYVKFVLACGGPFITSFTDPNLALLMPQVQINRLASVYKTVVDVDIFAGAISESPVPGSQFGFTFTCILLEQFNNSRSGDRFWYETNDHLVGFNIDQLDAIRDVTMSRVICDNADDVARIQPKAFRPRNNGDNDDVLCDDIPTVDLTPFKEEETCENMANSAPTETIIAA